MPKRKKVALDSSAPRASSSSFAKPEKACVGARGVEKEVVIEKGRARKKVAVERQVYANRLVIDERLEVVENNAVAETPKRDEVSQSDLVSQPNTKIDGAHDSGAKRCQKATCVRSVCLFVSMR